MATPWSFQLYSARNFQPWDKVLKMLGQVGYTQVEGFGGVYADPAAFRKELDSNGLAMPSGHFAIDLLENDFDGAAKIAKALGVSMIICPHIVADQRPTDAAGWQAFGKRLGKVGENGQEGRLRLRLAQPRFRVRAAARRLAAAKAACSTRRPNIGWEMDVAWVIRGGADPLKWIADYGTRIIAVHVKDIAPAGRERQ